jgi:hypothetical protein
MGLLIRLGMTAGLGWLGATGCSGEAPEQPQRAARAITGGSLDETHSNVFLLLARRSNRVALCTATLLAPNLLLTARHCVSPAPHESVECGAAELGEPFPASTFIATNDAEPTDDSRVFTAARVEVPEEGTDTCGYDIALVVLKQNVAPSVALPAVPRIDRQVAPGESYTAVGYGVDSSGESSGRRMQLRGLSITCEPGACNTDVVKATEFMGEKGVCSGDSGGPALDQDGKVVGVVSRGGPECTTPIYGAIAGWGDFIVRIANEAAAAGGYEPPFWATTGKSDPPDGLDGSGGSPSAGVAGSSSGGEGPSGQAGQDASAGAAGEGAVDATCQPGEPCGAALRSSCSIASAGLGAERASDVEGLGLLGLCGALARWRSRRRR